MSQPYPPPPPPTSPPPPPVTPAAPPATQVQGPALGLMITAAIGICLGLLSLAGHLFGMGMGSLQNFGSSGPGARYMQYMSGGIGIVFAIICLAVSAFIIWAAMQMKQLRGWNMSLAASILAMIPCIGPCCLVGIPIGIWSLIVLMKPEVKAAFVG